jgi:hypothetical protein
MDVLFGYSGLIHIGESTFSLLLAYILCVLHYVDSNRSIFYRQAPGLLPRGESWPGIYLGNGA